MVRRRGWREELSGEVPSTLTHTIGLSLPSQPRTSRKEENNTKNTLYSGSGVNRSQTREEMRVKTLKLILLLNPDYPQGKRLGKCALKA